VARRARSPANRKARGELSWVADAGKHVIRSHAGAGISVGGVVVDGVFWAVVDGVIDGGVVSVWAVSVRIWVVESPARITPFDRPRLVGGGGWVGVHMGFAEQAGRTALYRSELRRAGRCRCRREGCAGTIEVRMPWGQVVGLPGRKLVRSSRPIMVGVLHRITLLQSRVFSAMTVLMTTRGVAEGKTDAAAEEVPGVRGMGRGGDEVGSGHSDGGEGAVEKVIHGIAGEVGTGARGVVVGGPLVVSCITPLKWGWRRLFARNLRRRRVREGKGGEKGKEKGKGKKKVHSDFCGGGSTSQEHVISNPAGDTKIRTLMQLRSNRNYKNLQEAEKESYTESPAWATRFCKMIAKALIPPYYTIPRSIARCLLPMQVHFFNLPFLCHLPPRDSVTA